MELAELALVDYSAGRYHASIPVVLALLDGLVNQVGHRNKGFFADGTDLTAWDSIAGHSTGLNTLVSLFKKDRFKTKLEPISIPYRNGILHGMDLGYANKIVAAKSWAALFAAREWALKAERNALQQPNPPAETTWSDILQTLRENESTKRAFEQWKPRPISGADISGQNFEINDSCKNAPENVLVSYLNYWKCNNYGHMAKCIHSWPPYGTAITPSSVRQEFYDKNLSSYSIIKIIDSTPTICNISTQLSFVTSNYIIDKIFDFRLINTNDKGDPIVHGLPNSKWSIISWAVY